MRLRALVVCAIVAVVGVWLGRNHRRGLQMTCIPFSTNGATEESYGKFIKELRDELLKGGSQVFEIPVLKPKDKVHIKDRFLLVELSNSEHTITLGFDVVNVYLWGYRAAQAPRSYFFEGTPEEAFNTLFPGTQKVHLSFGCGYGQIEEAAHQSREKTELGMKPLETAISNLWQEPTGDQAITAVSLLVAIQMVSEAARFRSIQARVAQSIISTDPNKKVFFPDAAMRSLENNWDAFAKQIQLYSVQGIFTSNAVQLIKPDRTVVEVDSIYLFYVKGIALMQYKSPRDEDKQEAIRKGRMVVINGLNGLCADLRNGDTVELQSCGTQTSKWTPILVNPSKPQDGLKIQLPSGECLSGHGKAGSPVKLGSKSDCDKKKIGDHLKWKLSLDGTITNFASPGLVLNVDRGDQGAILTVQDNNRVPGQSWRLGEHYDPSTTSIRAPQGLCLQRNQENSGVEMKACIEWDEQQKEKEWERQQWDLYSDSSIRAYKDRSLCLTADGRTAGASVVIRVCHSDSSQRWVFKNDGFLLIIIPVPGKPFKTLAVERKSPVRIIINEPSGGPDKQWLPYF